MEYESNNELNMIQNGFYYIFRAHYSDFHVLTFQRSGVHRDSLNKKTNIVITTIYTSFSI